VVAVADSCLANREAVLGSLPQPTLHPLAVPANLHLRETGLDGLHELALDRVTQGGPGVDELDPEGSERGLELEVVDRVARPPVDGIDNDEGRWEVRGQVAQQTL
jgi:hypothetical protein